MRISIAQRLALLLALVGVLASGFTGYYAYSASRTLLVQAAEERLLTSTRVLVRQIAVSLESTTRDVRVLAGHPSVAAVLAGGDSASDRVRQTSMNNIASLFAGMLKMHPEYFQIRLISAADFGIERVRIDRAANGLLRITGDELQEKSHFPYVFDTLRQPVGTVYVSRAAINHESGAHAGQGKPSLHLAAPIYGAGKEPLGLVVINVDLNTIFDQLAADLPADLGLYLTNRQGDFLVHPDRTQAFSFDKGRRILLQDQFPAAMTLIDGGAEQVVTTVQLKSGENVPVVAAFVQTKLREPQQETFFILGLSQPLGAVLKESDALGRATLRIVLAFSVLSVLLAALLARAVTGPLNQMVLAVKRFATEQVRDPLPLRRGDELGVLARSFDDMQHQIQAQLAALQEKQCELDLLASHDSLTGLPNRRMFLSRLDYALARAQRSDEHLAVLFIDLDNFKEINDSLGHAVGDVMLRAVADRMQAVVRKIDTVARLGGDEFMILLDRQFDTDAIAQVARKLLDVLSEPVPYRGLSLSIGASIGIGQYPLDGGNATELIASADRAMYRAKCSGRNRYFFAGAIRSPD